LSDQDQEGSTVEEESLNNKMNGTITASPKSEANDDHDHQFHPTTMTMTMSKSYSITDLLNTIDYSALSQLLDAPAEPEPPLIYPTTTQTHESLLNYNNNSHYFNLPQVDACSDHVAPNCNGLKRKRVMTMDGAESSALDGSSSSNFSRKLKLPSDSIRSSSHSHFGSTTSSYCNQQQLVDTSGFQYSSLLSYPFLEMQ